MSGSPIQIKKWLTLGQFICEHAVKWGVVDINGQRPPLEYDKNYYALITATTNDDIINTCGRAPLDVLKRDLVVIKAIWVGDPSEECSDSTESLLPFDPF